MLVLLLLPPSLIERRCRKVCVCVLNLVTFHYTNVMTIQPQRRDLTQHHHERGCHMHVALLGLCSPIAFQKHRSVYLAQQCSPQRGHFAARIGPRGQDPILEIAATAWAAAPAM